MPVALTIEPLSEVADQPARKRWTRAECEKLERHGLLDVRRYELIEGELIDKMGKNQPHIIWLALLQAWCSRIFPGRVVTEGVVDVRPEDAPTNEPQPDIMVLRTPITDFLTHRPRPFDVSLLMEVSDSTLIFDTTIKAHLYARAGIPDYWVVDVNTRRIIVFREPHDGKYGTITAHSDTDSVSPLGAPQVSLRINDILPTEN